MPKYEGGTKCQLPEYPRSGLKVISVERMKKGKMKRGQYIRLNQKVKPFF